jgi:hypothetical protein
MASPGPKRDSRTVSSLSNGFLSRVRSRWPWVSSPLGRLAVLVRNGGESLMITNPAEVGSRWV